MKHKYNSNKYFVSYIFKINLAFQNNMNKNNFTTPLKTTIYFANLDLDLTNPNSSKEIDILKLRIKELSDDNENLRNLLRGKKIENEVLKTLNKLKEEELTRILTTHKFENISTNINETNLQENLLSITPTIENSHTITLDRSEYTRIKSKNRLLIEQKRKNAYVQKCKREGVAINEFSFMYGSPSKTLMRDSMISCLEGSIFEMNMGNIENFEELDTENGNLKEIIRNLNITIEKLKFGLENNIEKTNLVVEKEFQIQDLPLLNSTEKPKLLAKNELGSIVQHSNENININCNECKNIKDQYLKEINQLNQVIETNSKLMNQLEKQNSDLVRENRNTNCNECNDIKDQCLKEINQLNQVIETNSKLINQLEKQNSDFIRENIEKENINTNCNECNDIKDQYLKEISQLNQVIEINAKLINQLEKQNSDFIRENIERENDERENYARENNAKDNLQQSLMNMNVSYVLACIEIDRLESILSYNEAEHLLEIENLRVECSKLLQDFKLNLINMKTKIL